MISEDPRFRRELRQNLTTYFSLEELRTATFDLGVDWEELPGENKSSKSESLLWYFMRRNELATLLDYFRKIRPNVSWPTVSIGSTFKHALYHNLPQPDYVRFIGREKELEQIINLLKPFPHSQVHGIAISGIGGIGKSALALQVAHHYYRNADKLKEEERFDVIVWTSAKGSILTPQGIVQRQMVRNTLRDIFTAISITLEREDITSAPVEKQPYLVRKALTEQRTLLVVDHLGAIEDNAVLEFLRELPEPTKIIVTSRHRIDLGYPVRLSGMSWESANELIDLECDIKNIVLAETEKKLLYNHTGGVPLAIVWSIGLLFVGYSVDSVLYRLGQVGSDITAYTFEGLLNEIRGTVAQKLLLALSLFAQDADRDTLTEVAGIGDDFIIRDEGLAKLQALSLVNRTQTGRTSDRFSLLLLTKQLALSELDDAPNRQDYINRWREWQLREAVLYKPTNWYDFSALALRTEFENFQGGLDWAVASEDWELFLGLVVVVCWYYNYTGLWTELLETAEFGVKIAKEQGNLQVEAELRAALLGFAYSQRHEFDEAIHHVDAALNIYRDRLQDPKGEALALSFLAQVKRKEGALETAKSLYEQAYSRVLETEGKGRTFIAIQFELGKLWRDMENWDKAAEHFEEVQRWLAEKPDDPLNESQLPGAVLGHLALIQYHQGRFEVARHSCLESLKFFEARNLRVAFGSMYWRLALIEKALLNYQASLDAVDQATYWFERLGMLEDLESAQLYRRELETVYVQPEQDG